MALRNAQRKFVKFRPGLTIVAGRPFCQPCPIEVIKCQKDLNDHFRKLDVPILWYHPNWLHATIAAVTRSATDKKRFAPLTVDDLKQKSKWNKLSDVVRKQLPDPPDVLVDKIGERIGEWHAGENLPVARGVKIALTKPELLSCGHIILSAKCGPLEGLSSALCEKQALGEMPPSCHVTLGFLSPAARKKLSGVKAGQLPVDVCTEVEMSDILLAHYQSRTLATLHGFLRYNLDGSLAAGTGFSDLRI